MPNIRPNSNNTNYYTQSLTHSSKDPSFSTCFHAKGKFLLPIPFCGKSLTVQICSQKTLVCLFVLPTSTPAHTPHPTPSTQHTPSRTHLLEESSAEMENVTFARISPKLEFSFSVFHGGVCSTTYKYDL